MEALTFKFNIFSDRWLFNVSTFTMGMIQKLSVNRKDRVENQWKQIRERKEEEKHSSPSIGAIFCIFHAIWTSYNIWILIEEVNFFRFLFSALFACLQLLQLYIYKPHIVERYSSNILIKERTPIKMPKVLLSFWSAKYHLYTKIYRRYYCKI